MWLTLIVAETISASSGIGYMTMNAREFLQTDIVVLGIIVYALLGKLADALTRRIEALGARLASRLSRPAAQETQAMIEDYRRSRRVIERGSRLRVPDGAPPGNRRRISRPRGSRRAARPRRSTFVGASKAFGERQVLDDLDLDDLRRRSSSP